MYTTWFKGHWSDGNTPLIGAMDHGVWLASTVFDGARSIHRMAPDLRAHCQRTFESAERVGLGVPLTVDDMVDLCIQGIHRFPRTRTSISGPWCSAPKGCWSRPTRVSR